MTLKEKYDLDHWILNEYFHNLKSNEIEFLPRFSCPKTLNAMIGFVHDKKILITCGILNPIDKINIEIQEDITL